MDWTQRIEIGARTGANDQVTYDDLLRVSAEFPDYHERFLFGSVANHLADTFGTKGSPISLSTACASGASATRKIPFAASLRASASESGRCV